MVEHPPDAPVTHLDRSSVGGRLSRGRSALYGLVTVAAILGSLEIVARVVWAFTFAAPPSSPSDPASMPPSGAGDHARPLSQNADYSKDIPYDFRPNESGMIADTYVHTNNLGFRGRRPTLKKRPGMFRIVCVGDSVTFGYNATTDDRAYPAVLQRLLDPKDETIEVINAGRPGFESRHVAAFLKQRILDVDSDNRPGPGSLEPDLVLVECGWNDARQFSPPIEAKGPSLAHRLSEWIYLIRLPLRFREAARAGDPQWEERAAWATIERVRNGPPQRNPDAERDYRSALEAMAKVCRANHVEIVFIAPPNFLNTQLDDAAWRKCASHFAKYPTLSFQGWRTMIDFMVETNREVAQQFEVPFLDTSALSDARLFADICHPNDEGNERLAEHIRQALSDRGLVPDVAGE